MPVGRNGLLLQLLACLGGPREGTGCASCPGQYQMGNESVFQTAPKCARADGRCAGWVCLLHSMVWFGLLRDTGWLMVSEVASPLLSLLVFLAVRKCLSA